MSNNYICVVCNSGNNEATMLLCDGLIQDSNGSHICDRAFHTHCIGLNSVPAGAWRCGSCVSNNRPVAVEQALAAVPEVSPTAMIQGTKAFMYLRVSSKGQNNPEYGNHGLNTQNDALLGFARSRGLVVAGTYTETGSAYNGDQPQRQALLTEVSKAKNSGSVILVFSVSRWSRIMDLHLNELHRNGNFVYSVSENVNSYSYDFHTLAQSAMDQSEALGRAVFAAYKRITSQGGTVRIKAPYGKVIVRNPQGLRVEVDNQEEIILQANIKRWAPNYTAQQICDRLYQLGFSYRGKTWTPMNVKNVAFPLKTLKNPIGTLSGMKFYNVPSAEMEDDTMDESLSTSMSRVNIRETPGRVSRRR